jgi:tetratricopeptide (TPR) repeat protein
MNSLQPDKPIDFQVQDDISAMIDRANSAARKGDWPQTLEGWNAVLVSYPDHAPAYIGAAHALRELSRLKDAERFLDEGSERFPDNEQIAIARAWLCSAQQDWPAALGRWENFRARFPNNLWGYLGSIGALRNAGKADRVNDLVVTARSILTASRQRGLDPAVALAAEVDLAKATLDWSQVHQAAQEMTEREADPSPKLFLTVAQACWHMGDVDEADRTALRALSIDPGLSDAVVVRAWVATNRGDGETALRCYRRLAELNPGTVRWSLKVIQLLNRSGCLKEALSELEIVRSLWPDDPMVRLFMQNYGPAAAVNRGPESSLRGSAEDVPDGQEGEELHRVFDKSPGPSEWKRSLIVADPHGDVLVGRVTNAKAVALVFTGSNDALSLPLLTFDRYLASLNITAIYLKDFNRLRYLRGIKSLSDNYQGTLAALHDLLNQLRIDRICTLGNCDGGFAAIRYGVELGADRIVTFGAPTFSPKDSLSKIEQARNFMRNRLDANVSGDMMDLRPFLESRPHSSCIELFYEHEDDRDRTQALHIADLPGVRLHPQSGLSNHYLLRKLALMHEDFRGMLGQLLAVELKMAD